MILDEKALLPYPSRSHVAPAQASRGPCPSLPFHITLQIVHMVFPPASCEGPGILEYRRKVFYWLGTCLRLVNRDFYKACMHILRSTYLPSYDALIRRPYTSDPLCLRPHSTSSQARNFSENPTPSYTPNPVPTTLHTSQRETTTLDLYIALKIREDVWMDDSSLHLEREDAFRDLFDIRQPKSRLEDLVRYYGVREGVISAASVRLFNDTSPTQAPPYTRWSSDVRDSRSSRIKPIPFSCISVAFSHRKAGLVLLSAGRKKTLTEVGRTRDEILEVAARRLVGELKVLMLNGGVMR
ncbi:hypothetical protein BD779DRAFT_1532955 [Infundibulicybe gibba]|nr:hypothetical protein BD779DRAFT_1532955 [Infundibulicybe gibba]